MGYPYDEEPPDMELVQLRLPSWLHGQINKETNKRCKALQAKGKSIHGVKTAVLRKYLIRGRQAANNDP